MLRSAARRDGPLDRGPGVKAVDILGPGVELLSAASGLIPQAVVGAYRLPDEAYYDRIEAMEFTIKHDDGQQPEGLLEADVVLIGVSRTSKTPLSIYLASKGLRVANVPLVPLSEPPDGALRGRCSARVRPHKQR